MDKLIEALVEILANLGLDENAINGVIEQLNAKVNDSPVEENPTEDNPTEEPGVNEEPTQPNPTVEEPTEVESEAPSAELPPDEVVPPEGAVPPESAVPPVPPFDPTELLSKIDAVASENAELKKANDGLLARVQSLEEALKTAGVIDGTSPATQIGDEIPSAAPQSPTDDVLGDVMREINGHKRF